MARRREFEPADIRELIDELVRRLEARGISGAIRIVGGAALALRYPDDPDIRVTQDVDATWEPRAAVSRVITEIAAERGLEVDWINPAAASWLRTDAPSQSGGFHVVIATPEQLVAMKLAAGREQDLADLRVLAKHLGIRSAERLVEIAYEIYGDDSVELPDGRESYVLLAQAVLDRGR